MYSLSRLALELGELLADEREHALPEAGVAERDRGVAVEEEVVDLLALLETRERAVLPENRRRVGERAHQTVVAAVERAVAELHALVENLPELRQARVLGRVRAGGAHGGERHVHEVDRHDALVEASVIAVLAGLVVLGLRDVADAPG